MTAVTTEANVQRRPHLLKRLYLWVLHWAETPYGTSALFAISFMESSFFPVPPDVLQIALSVARPKRSFYYAAVSTVASVLGGVLGWLIGFGCWRVVRNFFFSYVPGFSQENFAYVQELYEDHGFLAIFSAAFTPVPYKVFTIGAGVFEIPLWTLVLASIAGRGGRFFLVGTLVFIFGAKVKHYLDKYFELVTLLFVVLLVGGFLVLKWVI